MKTFKVLVSLFLISVTTYVSAGSLYDYLNAELENSDRLMAAIEYYPPTVHAITNDMQSVKEENSFKRDYFESYQKNKEYIISSACGYNCQNIDMYVYDSDKNLIAKEDDHTGSKSMVSFITNDFPSYQLQVVINDCDESRCWFMMRDYIKK